VLDLVERASEGLLARLQVRLAGSADDLGR
jgi:hypothetical protein